MTRPLPPRLQGFTLIEISLVLLVIGLVVGGIVIGKTMIHNAELQSVISDVNRFKNAAGMFRDKYKYLPGDFPNAASLWGADTGCTTSTPNADATADNAIRKKTTCGGDGNGLVGGFDGSLYSSPIYIGDKYREALRAWQHLANARLIEGAYSGAVSDEAGKILVPGTNIPGSDLGNNSGFLFFYSYPVNSASELPDEGDAAGAYPSAYGHIISFGNPGATIKDGLNAPAITAADAFAIDRKTDDGKPALGNVMSFSTQNAPTIKCTSDDTPAATYEAEVEGINCALIFITGL